MSVAAPTRDIAKSSNAPKRKAESIEDKGDKPQKKRIRKHKKQPSETLEAPCTTDTHSNDAPKADAATNDTAHNEAVADTDVQTSTDIPTRKVRFIVFIGNLPYTCTTDAIQTHFSSVRPDSIRHITQKAGESTDNKKPQKGKSDKGKAADSKEPRSKGFAFLEFDSYDRMKACLKSFHHSKFNDGKSPARKINVELTAGGGGTKDVRRQRLREKNERLQEQRRRRSEKEQQEKAQETQKEAAQTEVAEAVANVHPSRRNRVKH